MSVDFPAGSPAPVGLLPSLVRRRGDRGRLRSASAVLFVPAVVMAVLFVGARWAVEPFANRPYALALAAQANGTVVLIGPFVAVAAAWEMGTLRTLWGRMVVRRSWSAVVAGRLGLVVGSGLLAMAVVYAVVGGTSLLTEFPGWSFPALSVAGVLAWTAFGAATALVFRQLVALPLAVLAPFLVLGLPQGWSPLWLRHVNGYLFDCCGTSEILDRRAVVASLAFLAAVFACSAAVMGLRLAQGPRQVRLSLTTAVGTVVVAVVGGGLTIAPVRHLGALPTAQRSPALLRCTGAVCLWPEDDPARAANERAWQRIGRTWARLGLPRAAARIGPIPGPGMLGIATASTSTAQATTSMAAALPRALAGCSSDYTDQTRNDALDRLSYLLLAATGRADPGAVPLPPGTTPPRPADAPRLWAGVRRCSP